VAFCDIVIMTRRLCCLIVLFIPLSLLGQSSHLLGTVRTPDGSAIPNAFIEFRNIETGAQLKAKTGRHGEFRIASVKDGTYQATVRAEGFRTLSRDDIRVKPQERVQLELVLQPTTPGQ